MSARDSASQAGIDFGALDAITTAVEAGRGLP